MREGSGKREEAMRKLALFIDPARAEPGRRASRPAGPATTTRVLHLREASPSFAPVAFFAAFLFLAGKDSTAVTVYPIPGRARINLPTCSHLLSTDGPDEPSGVDGRRIAYASPCGPTWRRSFFFFASGAPPFVGARLVQRGTRAHVGPGRVGCGARFSLIAK